MIAASFYAPRPGNPQHDPYDFWDCLKLQHQSCLRFGIDHFVITDVAGASMKPPELWAFVADLPANVMQASIIAHLAFLEEAARSQDDILLLDADGILSRDPRPLFDGSFDLAVTTHPFADSILNNGLIAVSKGSAGLVAPFWRAALGFCGIGWGEDQKALGRAVNATLEHGVHDRNGVRVKFLPCRGFNWAPEGQDDPVDALFVHFRGPRKKYMRRWVERFARDPA